MQVRTKAGQLLARYPMTSCTRPVMRGSAPSMPGSLPASHGELPARSEAGRDSAAPVHASACVPTLPSRTPLMLPGAPL